jgi:PadR family transcriptional regulator PadR
MSTNSPNRIELVQGTLDMLILRTLQIGPAHGHQIAKHLQRTTDDVLQVEHGSLYPALHRLERKKLACGQMGTGRQGFQTQTQVLSTDSKRPKAAVRRGVAMEANGARDRSRDMARSGELR